MTDGNQNSEAALVTGASLRIGRAIALDLAARGWRVGVHYHRSAEEADAVVHEIEALGGTACALQADLAEPGEMLGLIERCAAELGPVTCLINNAARFEWDQLETLDVEGWQAEFDINLLAPVFLSQAFAKALPKAACGSIVNIIDQRVLRPEPDYFSYTLTKSGLWTATVMLARALGPNIRVNAIGPGPVLPNRRQSQEDFEHECRSTLLGRGVAIEDICAAVRFLIDTKSVTGQMIALDCGQHLV